VGRDILDVLKGFDEEATDLKQKRKNLGKLQRHIEEVLNPEKQPEQDFILPENYKQLTLLYEELDQKIDRIVSERNSKIKTASELFTEMNEDLRKYSRGELEEQDLVERYDAGPQMCVNTVRDYNKILRDKREQINPEVPIEDEQKADIDVIAGAIDDYLGFKQTFSQRKQAYVEENISEEKMAETALELGRKRGIAEDAFGRLEDIDGVVFEDYEEENQIEMSTEEYHNHLKAGTIYNKYLEGREIELDDHWQEQIIGTLIEKGEREASVSFHSASSL